MILSDVITIQAAPIFDQKNIKHDEINNASRLSKYYANILEIQQSYHNVDNKLVKEIKEDLHLSKSRIVEKFGSLPKQLHAERDPMTVASISPRMELSDCRKICDQLGFIMFPFEYIKDEFLPKYDRREINVKVSVDGFVQNLPSFYKLYVLAPVSAYDIQKHLVAKTDMEIYSGMNHGAFMAISISMPFFRTLNHKVQKLDHQMREMRHEIDSTKNEIKALTVRVSELEKKLEAEQKARLVEMTRIKQEMEELRQARVWPQEPLLLGVPSTTSVGSGDGSCIVGPCWGPDFDDIVFQVLKLKKIEGQRNMLYDFSQKWVLN